ncbi:DedA family protein [Streptomyces sp900105755]|uniref:DedA family protein n=1 Tax=Streptomyces sp. 900105755 TaxID=3154389 RepID=UPI003324637E
MFVTPERFQKAEEFCTRHGGKIVVVARFVEGLRQVNGVIAGTSGMPWRRFLVFNAIGAALRVGLWANLAYVAGRHITAIYEEISRYQLTRSSPWSPHSSSGTYGAAGTRTDPGTGHAERSGTAGTRRRRASVTTAPPPIRAASAP